MKCVYVFFVKTDEPASPSPSSATDTQAADEESDDDGAITPPPQQGETFFKISFIFDRVSRKDSQSAGKCKL